MKSQSIKSQITLNRMPIKYSIRRDKDEHARKTHQNSKGGDSTKKNSKTGGVGKILQLVQLKSEAKNFCDPIWKRQWARGKLLAWKYTIYFHLVRDLRHRQSRSRQSTLWNILQFFLLHVSFIFFVLHNDGDWCGRPLAHFIWTERGTETKTISKFHMPSLFFCPSGDLMAHTLVVSTLFGWLVGWLAGWLSVSRSHIKNNKRKKSLCG